MKTQMVNNIQTSYPLKPTKPTNPESGGALSLEVERERKDAVLTSQGQESAPDLNQLNTMVEQVNTDLEYVQKSLHFRIHETSGKMMVEVTDSETGEVIKTMPPEWFLNVLGRIRTALGTFIDEEV